MKKKIHKEWVVMGNLLTYLKKKTCFFWDDRHIFGLIFESSNFFIQEFSQQSTYPHYKRKRKIECMAQQNIIKSV